MNEITQTRELIMKLIMQWNNTQERKHDVKGICLLTLCLLCNVKFKKHISMAFIYENT